MEVARYLETVTSVPNYTTEHADSDYQHALEPQMTRDVNVICD